MSTIYKGILPALQVPFREDLSIDEADMRHFVSWLLGFKGIGGLVTNGHTGEVFALTTEGARGRTRIVAEEARGRCPVISGVCCEGIG